MLIKDIVNRVNQLLAGEMLSYNQMVMHLDSVIDDINSQLNAVFPAFSELPAGTTEYTCFPDRYIRTVVCVGAVSYFYTTDEEGSPAAEQYASDYAKWLFYMLRDYVSLVPQLYKAPDTYGALTFNLTGSEDVHNTFDPSLI